MLDLPEWQQWNYMAQGQKEKGKEPLDNFPMPPSSSEP
jgi:hypothetical protein